MWPEFGMNRISAVSSNKLVGAAVIMSFLLCDVADAWSAGSPPAATANQAATAPTESAGRGQDLYGDALPVGAIQRLGTVRFRHNSTAIAYSSDGKLLASGGRENVIRLFEAATGREIRRFTGHGRRTYNPPSDPQSPLDALVSATGEGGVNSVAFSPDGKLLASGGWDDTVRIWDVQTGKELRKIDAHKAMVGHVRFSPDGKFLASRGGLDGTLRLWDPVTGTSLQKFVGLSNINPWRFNHDLALDISPDSRTIAATARNAIVLFDVSSGAELRRIPAHVYGIAVAYSPDGKQLASGGVDEGKDVYSLRLWDVATGKETRRCDLPKNEPPTYLAWNPTENGQIAAVVAEDDMHVFDTTTGKESLRLRHYWPSRVAYTPDGKSLASAGSGPTIRHWDAATGNELHLDFAGHQAGVVAVAAAGDGHLVASGGDGIRLWDRETGKLIRTIPGTINCLAMTSDGKLLAAGSRDRKVRLWNAETGEAVRELPPHRNGICGITFSADGALLASGDVQSTIRIWNVNDGKQLQEIDNKSGTESLGLAFLPDGKTLVCGGAWNDSSFLPKAGTVIKINGKEVKFDGGISIQGVEMVRKEGDFVLQWDIATGQEVRRFGGLNDRIRSMVVSADGKTIAAASRDGRICLWDTESGRDKLHILAHPTQGDSFHAGAPALAFSPDGKTLATAGADRTIRLWDTTSARELGRIDTLDGAVLSLVFSRDGKLLLSGGTDTGVLVWDITTAGRAPPVAGRNVITLE